MILMSTQCLPLIFSSGRVFSLSHLALVDVWGSTMQTKEPSNHIAMGSIEYTVIDFLMWFSLIIVVLLSSLILTKSHKLEYIFLFRRFGSSQLSHMNIHNKILTSWSYNVWNTLMQGKNLGLINLGAVEKEKTVTTLKWREEISEISILIRYAPLMNMT